MSRIQDLIEQATKRYEPDWNGAPAYEDFDKLKFAELIIKDYAQKTIQGLMSDPAFVQHMDEYYEQKWAHRFD